MNIIIPSGSNNDHLLFEDFEKSVFAAAERSIELATVPLESFSQTKAEYRTGVLIQIAEQRFMVTAAHGLKEYHDNGGILHMLMMEKGLAPVQLEPHRFRSTIDPLEDLCVTELSESTVRAIDGQFSYIRLDSMMSQHDERHGTGLYLLLGFPFDMLRFDETSTKRLEPWKYLSPRFDGEPAEPEKFNPALHCMLHYDRESFNREGGTVHPPGLSGCGIWFVGDPVSNALFNENDFKLAGIQTAWSRQRQYVKGTWTDQVLRILWRYYPDTRSLMRLQGIEF